MKNQWLNGYNKAQASPEDLSVRSRDLKIETEKKGKCVCQHYQGYIYQKG
jgi:hypothetical protein